MKPLLLLLMSPLIISASNSSESCRIDYYWRDYFGKIPEDAVTGGYLPSGKPFYIGQVYITDIGLLPAAVYSDKPLAKTSNGGKTLEKDHNIKILCSPYPNNFNWTQMRSEDLSRLTYTHVIIGGTQGGQALYIGRVFEYDSLVLGKIYNHFSSHKGIWVPTINMGQANYLSYEILTYNCSNVSIVPQ